MWYNVVKRGKAWYSVVKRVIKGDKRLIKDVMIDQYLVKGCYD